MKLLGFQAVNNEVLLFGEEGVVARITSYKPLLFEGNKLLTGSSKKWLVL